MKDEGGDHPARDTGDQVFILHGSEGGEEPWRGQNIHLEEYIYEFRLYKILTWNQILKL